MSCKVKIKNLLDYNTVSSDGHPTMADCCYWSMFQNCTSLTTAPELPATFCLLLVMRVCSRVVVLLNSLLHKQVNIRPLTEYLHLELVQLLLMH